jgi:hypothetical protein
VHDVRVTVHEGQIVLTVRRRLYGRTGKRV